MPASAATSSRDRSWIGVSTILVRPMPDQLAAPVVGAQPAAYGSDTLLSIAQQCG